MLLYSTAGLLEIGTVGVVRKVAIAFRRVCLAPDPPGPARVETCGVCLRVNSTQSTAAGTLWASVRPGSRTKS